jgi:hypothetical protein
MFKGTFRPHTLELLGPINHHGRSEPHFERQVSFRVNITEKSLSKLFYEVVKLLKIAAVPLVDHCQIGYWSPLPNNLTYEWVIDPPRSRCNCTERLREM